MYIEEYVGDKDALLLEAMQHPTLAPKRRPTIEVALKCVVALVERRVREGVAAAILPDLHEAYDMHEISMGEREQLVTDAQHGEVPAALVDDWESALDDAVEKLVEPFQTYLSADWLATNTIDTRLWEDGAFDKWAASMGKEVYKQLAFGKTPAQILSNAGITAPDVDIYLSQHLATEIEDTPMPMENPQLQAVVDKIAAHVGGSFDPTVIYGDLELAILDDDILAMGAGGRLGLEQPEVVVLQMYAMDHGEDAADELAAAVQEAVTAMIPPPGKRTPKAPKTENAVVNALDPAILTLLKDHSAVMDTDMAKAIGVSRQTYNNYRDGKTQFAATDEQKATLRSQIVQDVNGLLAALALVDGAQAMAVQ